MVTKAKPKTSSAKTSTSSSRHDPDPPNDGKDNVEGSEADVIERLLQDHGVKKDDIPEIWEALVSELRDISAAKPMLTALAIFLLGFAAGRASVR